MPPRLRINLLLHPECQKDDWKEHKSFCKALVDIENPTGASIQHLLGGHDDDPSNYFNSEIERVNYNAKARGATKTMVVKMQAGRGLSPAEQSLIDFEPGCLAWCVQGLKLDMWCLR